jgi:hypothetical protein
MQIAIGRNVTPYSLVDRLPNFRETCSCYLHHHGSASKASPKYWAFFYQTIQSHAERVNVAVPRIGEVLSSNLHRNTGCVTEIYVIFLSTFGQMLGQYSV